MLKAVGALEDIEPSAGEVSTLADEGAAIAIPP
ncbi:Uncharacterised protein [Brevundimonas diminuta]|jgi:hypothetical protein|uniref:Uncharacterized protein n=1 Tax=Brevundimonas diminuta TaxID=293 RepID=A0A2X1B0B8_BREDI|nr:Uncharacterised protein [Brevundimonas diminuta]